MFWTDFLKKKNGTPLSRVWLIAHSDKKITKYQISQMNLQNVCNEIIDPMFRKFSLRTMAFLLLGVTRANLSKASYLYQDCYEIFLKLHRDSKTSDFDLPVPTINAVTYREEDIFNQRLSLIDFHNFDEFYENRDYDRITNIQLETHLSLNEVTMRPIEDHQDNEFGDERLQIAFEELNLTDNISNSRNITESNNEIPEGLTLQNIDNRIESTILQQLSLIEPEFNESVNNELVDRQVERENLSQSNLTLISNLQDNDGFILPAVETSQAKRKKKRKLIVDKEIIIRSEIYKKQLQNQNTSIKILDIAPITKRMMKLMKYSDVENSFMILPGREFHSPSLIKHFKRNLVTKLIIDSPQSSEDDSITNTRKRKRVSEEDNVSEINQKSKRPSMEQNDDQQSNTQMETLSHTLENSNINTETSTQYGMEFTQENEPDMISVKLSNLSETAMDAFEGIQSILTKSTSINRPSLKKVTFSEPVIREYSPEELDSSNPTSPVITMNNKKSQKRNLLKILIPKLNNSNHKITFRNLVEKKIRCEVALLFNTLLTVKKEKIINLEQAQSFSEIHISPGENYSKYSHNLTYKC